MFKGDYQVPAKETSHEILHIVFITQIKDSPWNTKQERKDFVCNNSA